MNRQQIARFVERYLEATQCRIIERTPSRITVKLSPEADKALTNRPYYWSFVERTGAEPETMTFTFAFDEAALEASGPGGAGGPGGGRPPGAHPGGAEGDGILARYFGPTPTVVQYNPGRPRAELIHYGCGRLEQMFRIVREQGRFVNLYEQPANPDRYRTPGALTYTAWLGVNYKVAYICDLKRDELHSLGISLVTGEIVPSFHEQVCERHLAPKLPANAAVRRSIPLHTAAVELEKRIERHVLAGDHRWAEEAHERLVEELARIDGFYEETAAALKDEGERAAALAQRDARRAEAEWQYRPRIEVTVVNCGLFHLLAAPSGSI
jgi:hypothetical protein